MIFIVSTVTSVKEFIFEIWDSRDSANVSKYELNTFVTLALSLMRHGVKVKPGLRDRGPRDPPQSLKVETQDPLQSLKVGPS